MTDHRGYILTGPYEGALPVRKIDSSDLVSALREGLSDFMERPSHLIFLCVIYPIIGLFLGRLVFQMDILPLLYPMAAGFALLGPFAGIGLYELSRRREQGLDTHLSRAFDVRHSPGFGSILALGMILVAIFLLWILTARIISDATIGPSAPGSTVVDLLREVFTTQAGWTLLIVGNFVGLLFAIVAMSISVVSFPLLVDRDVSVAQAVQTSLAAVRANPVTMAEWGLVVAAALALGSVPLFIGLAVVMPVLGHATWHLYRRVVP
jgi:uncharacterized membrane protein